MPNLEPTRLIQVYHFWTHRRQVKRVGLGGRTSSKTGQFSVGVESCKTIPKSDEIHRIYTKSSRRCWDLAISWLIELKPPAKCSHWWKTMTFSGVIRSDWFFFRVFMFRLVDQPVDFGFWGQRPTVDPSLASGRPVLGSDWPGGSISELVWTPLQLSSLYSLQTIQLEGCWWIMEVWQTSYITLFSNKWGLDKINFVQYVHFR